MSTAVTDPAWMSRIRAMADRSAQVAEEMNKPEVATNPARMTALVREHGQLEKLLRPYREYRKLTDDLNSNIELAADPSSEAELREMAEAEVDELRGKRETLLQQMQERLVTGNEAAISSVIVEIRAGTGGDEAALFAGELLAMYQAWSATHGFKVEVLSLSESDLGGIKEGILNITGDEVYLKLRFEGGGHRVQRVPKTEAQGRIHTSAATVAVLPEPEEVEVEIDWEKDVVEHVSRAGGPGGQNVNKVASAIKLEHLPTGITVSMRDEKSQHKNRAKARRILMSRVFEHFQSQQHAALSAERKSMMGSGDRSDRIRTYNFPQNRVTDHRVNIDVFDMEGVLVRGELDAFHEKLRERDIQLRLDAIAEKS